jgi:phospholipid/cholesterol/gamma-HCH transport system substrate-binding protein
MNLELSRRTVLGVVAFFAVSLALLWLMLARLGALPLPGGRTESVRAVFANAEGLTTQSDVLVHGVGVGTVTGIAARPGGTLVTLTLGSGAPILHRDASVRVGFKTPLGEPFVDLDPGSSRARLAAEKPLRTESTVEIDDALSFLDRAGRANARSALVALGQGAGSPATSETESQDIGELEQATAQVDNLASELSAQKGDVSGLINDGGAVLGALAQRSSELSQLTSAADATLQAVAGQRAALGGVLDRLPGLLTASHDTLLAVRPLIATAMPVATELSRAAPPLTRALKALPATSSELGQVLGQAGAIQHDVVPVLSQLRALAAPANIALGRLGPALADLVPVAQYLGPRGKTMAAWFANTAALGDHGDAKGDWARFFVMFDPSTVTGTKLNAPAGNSYTAPGDAAHNEPYEPGDYPHLMPYAPALGK